MCLAQTQNYSDEQYLHVFRYTRIEKSTFISHKLLIIVNWNLFSILMSWKIFEKSFFIEFSERDLTVIDKGKKVMPVKLMRITEHPQQVLRSKYCYIE